jgi:hypothetical protein
MIMIIIIIIIIIITGLRDEYRISVGNLLRNTDEDIKRNIIQQFNHRQSVFCLASLGSHSRVIVSQWSRN